MAALVKLVIVYIISLISSFPVIEKTEKNKVVDQMRTEQCDTSRNINTCSFHIKDDINLNDHTI